MEDVRRAVRYGLARRISDLKHLLTQSAVDEEDRAQASLIIEDLERIYQDLG